MQKSPGGELAAFQVTSHCSKILEGVFKKQSQSASHIVFPDAMVIRFIMTEVDIKSSHTTEEQSFECYSSADEEKRPTPEDVHPSCFVNDAAIAWHENRREWVGDQSQRSKRVPRDSVISWSMTYEDLLSTNEPFQEPIPLPSCGRV